MLILHAKNIKKYYGERLILDIPDFKMHSGEHVGLVGINGCGKSTFLKILTGEIKPDEGEVLVNSTWEYITQLDNVLEKDFKSGGEITKTKIFDAVSCHPEMLFADEPTANLDDDAINKTESILSKHSGALLLVSHDRSFLDSLCHKILYLDNGKIKEYIGNYSEFIQQRKMEKIRRDKEYRRYAAEKQHLEHAISCMSKAEGRIKKTPKRMGNSEARLHKRSSTEIKQHLARHRKGLQARIANLDVKEKPRVLSSLKIYHQGVKLPVSKTALRVDIKEIYGGRNLLIENVKLNLATGSKTALSGSNGSGKTTLLKSIWQNSDGVRLAPGSRTAYFSQKLDVLDDNKTLFDNVMYSSTIEKSIVRTVLASMLFQESDIYKKTSKLSGGERVKLQLACVLLSGADFLILDEVTNYLDIQAIEALEKLLFIYPGTVLYVSHDNEFIKKTADRKLRISDKQIADDTYLKNDEPKTDINIALLEIRLAELSAKLSKGDISDENRERDSMEYEKVRSKLKTLKN